jgi:vacuolar-type H+-ATPase subunit H
MVNLYQVIASENHSLSRPECAIMCAANDAIDIIHEAEEKATKRIQEAGIAVRQMKEQTEAEVKRILQEAESQTKKAAAVSGSDITKQKEEIERRSRKDLEAVINGIEESARNHRTAAIQVVAKILLGE